MINHTSNIVPFPQEGDHQAHLQLLDFLESEGGEHFGLTKQKYLERGELRPSKDSPGKYTLSLERHRAVLGDTYQKGLPMASFETYSQELIFDPAVPSLTEIAQNHLGYSIDVHALAQKHMMDYNPTVEMRHDSSSRKVELSVINWSMKTSSLAEAKAEVAEQVRNLCLEGVFEYLDGIYESYPSIETEFEDACVEHVLERLVDAWNDPDMEDDVE